MAQSMIIQVFDNKTVSVHDHVASQPSTKSHLTAFSIKLVMVAI